MVYIENPKTKGSNIICCIPHSGKNKDKGICANKCEDCFFQSGRSYLEPLTERLPNMPSLEQAEGKIVRVNDGHDSNIRRTRVLMKIKKYGYKDFFFNTAIPRDLEGFKIDGLMRPVVLTINKGKMTDKRFHKLDSIPNNLMFVRFRANTWNTALADKVVEHYTKTQIPVMFTFMAYYTETIPKGHENNYTYRKRTLNSYWVINLEASKEIMNRYETNEYVYTCGKNANSFPCHRCGGCSREYFNTRARLLNI